LMGRNGIARSKQSLADATQAEAAGSTGRAKNESRQRFWYYTRWSAGGAEPL